MKPLILDFKCLRSEDSTPISYRYCVAESLNVIEINGILKPFIDSNKDDLELMTKTKTNRERDDDHFLYELGTKTEIKRERDDLHDGLIELETKTFVAKERDDQDPAYYE